MSAIDVHVFRDAVGKVVRALTDSNIKVRQQGMQAYVKYDSKGRPIEVTLPSIPDNAPQDLLNAIQGFIDHEVSHILHTDFAFSAKLQQKAKREGDKLTPALWNVIEDVFIERRMSERFTGSRLNLDNVQRFITHKLLSEKFDKLEGEDASEGSFKALLLPSAVRAAAGQKPYADFMKDKWERLGELAEPIKKLGAKLASLKSTEECWKLAQTIKEEIQPSAPPSPPSPNKDKNKQSQAQKKKSQDDQESDGSEDPENEDQSDSQDDSESAPKPKPKSNDSKGESDDKEDEGDEGDEGDGDGDSEGDDDLSEDDQDTGTSAQSEGDGDEGENEDGDGDTEDNNEETPEQMGVGVSRNLDEAENEAPDGSDINPDDIKSLDDLAAEMIEDQIRKHMKSNPRDYQPWSRDYDYLGPIPQAEGWQQFSLDKSEIVKQATEQCHVIQGEVERVFRARSAARWNPGQRKGKLNRTGLHRACIGDDRVFRTKIEANSRDVAVQLVIDCSGSMSGSKIKSAAIAAYMLASVLERVGVSLEIMGFTTMESGNPCIGKDNYNRALREIQDSYETNGYDQFSRYKPLCHYTIKEFTQRLDDRAKKTLGFLDSTWEFMGGNADGESIELCAMRLAKRKEARKVMIVMSDGQPAADGDWGAGITKLKETTAAIESSDIELYGLGLMDDSVKGYYSKCEVISSTSEIPSKVLALVQRLLVG